MPKLGLGLGLAFINRPFGENINGLIGKRYSGYFGSLVLPNLDNSQDNVNFADTFPFTGETNQLTKIESFTSNADNYSWEWLGYFKAATTESYTFYTNSDDASYLWIGDLATSGYTKNNATVKNGGLHGPTENSGSVNLIAGNFYPIRIQFGEASGGDIMTVSFSTGTISKTTNGLGYYFTKAPNVSPPIVETFYIVTDQNDILKTNTEDRIIYGT